MAIPILKLGVNNYCNGSNHCEIGNCQCDALAIADVADRLNYRLGDKVVAITTFEGVNQNPVIRILGSNLRCIIDQVHGKCSLEVVERGELVLLTETKSGTLRTIFRVRREDRQIHVVHNYLTKIQHGLPINKTELGNACSPLGKLVRECIDF